MCAPSRFPYGPPYFQRRITRPHVARITTGTHPAGGWAHTWVRPYN